MENIKKYEVESLLELKLIEKFEVVYKDYMEQNDMPFYVYNSSFYSNKYDYLACDHSRWAIDDFMGG